MGYRYRQYPWQRWWGLWSSRESPPEPSLIVPPPPLAEFSVPLHPSVPHGFGAVTRTAAVANFPIAGLGGIVSGGNVSFQDISAWVTVYFPNQSLAAQFFTVRLTQTAALFGAGASVQHSPVSENPDSPVQLGLFSTQSGVGPGTLGLITDGTQQVFGPFFKPPGHAIIVHGPTAAGDVAAGFRWVEEPREFGG